MGEGRNLGLTDLRLARGLSRAELSEAAGLSKMTYHRLEHGVGTRTPDQATLSANAWRTCLPKPRSTDELGDTGASGLSG